MFFGGDMKQELVLSLDPADFAVLSRQPIWRRLALALPTRRRASGGRTTLHRLKLESWQQVEAELVRPAPQAGQPPACRIVLRLVSGEPGVLYRFARELQDLVPLRLAAVTRFGETGAAKARPIALDPSMRVQDALYAIVGNCVEQIRANEQGVVGSSHPEFIHQMRVGLRRLNAALGLFRPLVPCPPTLRDELRWIRQALGAARDWEVLAGDTLAPMIAESRDEAGLEGLLQAVLKKAAANRRRAAAAVRSARYTRCLLSLGEWAETLRNQPLASTQIGVAPPGNLLAFALPAMARRDAQLRRRGKKLREADVEARHEVRLVAKKVRYAAEFFRSLYPTAAMRDYIEELAALQEVLGVMNDAFVADGLLRHGWPDGQALVSATGFARGYLAARHQRDAKRLLRRWRQFRDVRLPLPAGE